MDGEVEYIGACVYVHNETVTNSDEQVYIDRFFVFSS